MAVSRTSSAPALPGHSQIGERPYKSQLTNRFPSARKDGLTK